MLGKIVIDDELNIGEMVDKLLEGDSISAARLLTLIERETADKSAIMDKLYSIRIKSTIIGVTGAAGVGKSTFINRLIEKLRKQNKTVGVVLVDPSSDITGGAILGDRIRLQQHSCDKGVFIRSMASKGEKGGVARDIFAAIRIIDALGFDYIIVETIGAGQSDIDIKDIAHTSLLLLSPDGGDELQIIKSGIMEIADIVIINKSDVFSPDKFKALLETYYLNNGRLNEKWKLPVFSLCSLSQNSENRKRFDDVVGAIQQHKQFLVKYNLVNKIDSARIKKEIEHILHNDFLKKIYERIKELVIDQIDFEKVGNEALNPYIIVKNILDSKININTIHNS